AGATWTFVDTNALGPGGSARVVFDDYGNLFLAYDSLSTPRVVASTDGGQTFNLLLGTDVPGYGRPALATGPGGVWVAFRGPANNILVTGAPVSGLGNVGTFGSFQTVPNSVGGDIPAIAVGPTGQVMVAYQSPGTGSRRSTLLTSLDPDGFGPNGFNNPVVVAAVQVGGFRLIPAQPNAGIDTAPSLAWDRSNGPFKGRVYLAYVDAISATTSDTNIFVRYSTNNGLTWNVPRQVNHDTTAHSQFNPALAVDQTTGNVAVAWLHA